MKRIALTIAVATAALAAPAATSPAGAAADPVIGMEVLDLLCAARGGTPINSPVAIARCQTARPGKGFEVEALICEGLLEGTFASAPSFDRPRRTTWACFPGAI